LRQTKSDKKSKVIRMTRMNQVHYKNNKIAVKAIIENAAPTKSKTLQLIQKENFLFTYIKLLK
jgi:hypothetical protein